MAATGLHDALDRRLADLGERITQLKRKNTAAAARPDKEAAMAEFERRHLDLMARLHALHREGTGFRNETKAAIFRVADDLSANLDDWVATVDRDYASENSAPPPRKG